MMLHPTSDSSSSSRRSEKLQQKREQLKQASELLRFSYCRQPTEDALGSVGGAAPSSRKHHHRSRGLSISKSQYVQANFRFILSPLMSPSEPCLYEADETVPWSQVVCVIVPRGSDDKEVIHNYEKEESYCLECPICLDDAQIPKITSCGHMFCCTCILRHLCGTTRGSSKCPICSEFLCVSDLKSVAASPHTADSIREKLIVNNHLEFTLLELRKGFVAPMLMQSGPPSPPPDSKSAFDCAKKKSSSLNAAIPTALDANAPYSRLTFITADMMRELFSKDRDSLLQYRQLCLQSTVAAAAACYAPTHHRLGDVESLPYIEQALDLLERAEADFQRRSSQHQQQQQHYEMLSSSRLSNRESESQLLSDRSLPGCESSSGPISSTTITVDEYSSYSSNSSSLTTTTTCAEKSLKSVDEQANRSSSAVTIKHSSSPSMKQSSSSASCSPSTYPIYQLYTGEMIFLHPLCTRCLVESAADRAAAGGGGGGPSSLPSLLRGRIVDIESIRVTVSNRQRYNVLRHLPLHCEVTLIEIDLFALVPSSVVSDHILSNFKDQLSKRAQLRKEKKRLIIRESKVDLDRKLAEDMQRAEQVEYSQELKRAESAALEELLNGPTLVSSIELSSDPASEHAEIVPAHRSFASITQVSHCMM